MRHLRKYMIIGFSAIFGRAIVFITKVIMDVSNYRQIKKCNSIGDNIYIGRDLLVDNAGNISIANNVSILNHCLLSSYQNGSIHVGENCFLGDNCKIVSERANIWIDDDCLIAEGVSIRASNHGTKAGVLIRLQKNSVSDIWIGKDVWIGKGATILAGSIVADGCIIGANSVVRGRTEANTIYAGVPIKKIKIRGD